MAHNFSKDNGFTLVELLIYMAVIGGVSMTFILYSLAVAQSRAKTYVAQEVQANATKIRQLLILMSMGFYKLKRERSWLFLLPAPR